MVLTKNVATKVEWHGGEVSSASTLHEENLEVVWNLHALSEVIIQLICQLRDCWVTMRMLQNTYSHIVPIQQVFLGFLQNLWDQKAWTRVHVVEDVWVLGREVAENFL